ncbi:MAG TPA: NYN domain-containing protein [Actinomycetota bacterium]|nr:NYN domain-containing protein [Actinomycetota bacterium]
MDEERIALFIDYENLAIGAREHLGQQTFDFGPIADALAERGRVVVRRAYADWSYFSDDRRDLTRHHIELIEIPQKMGMARKNAADIKLAVDAMELSSERAYISTFVICTGDSDFTPLVHKLREHNRKVLGIGIEGSTSNLLPPACDEFLFYDRLAGVQPRRRHRGRQPEKAAKAEPDEQPAKRMEPEDLDVRITRTLAGLKRSSDTVLGSHLKRTLLRKDPTFDESEYGFRSFGELLQDLAERKVLQVTDGPAKGDPQVDLARTTPAEQESFDLLREVVSEIAANGSAPPPLAGLKNEMRKRKPRFSEKRFGYGGFLQFVKAAQTRGLVEMTWDEETGDYLVRAATPKAAADEPAPEGQAAQGRKRRAGSSSRRGPRTRKR